MKTVALDVHADLSQLALVTTDGEVGTHKLGGASQCRGYALNASCFAWAGECLP
jgi:hypothetical protein